MLGQLLAPGTAASPGTLGPLEPLPHGLSGHTAITASGIRHFPRWLVRQLRTGFSVSVAWLRTRTPEQYLWVFMAIMLAIYVLILFTASTGTGRGGR
jgi:hypothetical protein